MTAANANMTDHTAAIQQARNSAWRIARFGIALLVFGLGGFLLWASLAPLDKGVAANGTVVIAGEKKIVQSLLGGSIERILVHDGDLVQEGQVLIQLNTLKAQADLDIGRGQWFSSRSVQARLTAERMGMDKIDWPADLLAHREDARAQAAMNLQQSLFETRASELRSRLQIQQHEVSALEQQLKGYEEIRRNYAEQLKFQQQELDGMRALAQEGYVPRNRLYEAERNTAQLGVQLTSVLADIGRTQQAINESKLKILQQTQVFRSEAEAQLTQVTNEVSLLDERLKTLDSEVRNSAISAPVSGQVMGLAVHTEGGVLTPGQRVMDVVPQGSRWLIRAQFPPRVVDRLTIDLPVRIRFNSLKRIHTPTLQGRVVMVSPDQLIDEYSKQPYFAVEIAVDDNVLKTLSNAGLDVKPGMQAEVVVKTGERTLKEYLLQPVSEKLAGALKEE